MVSDVTADADADAKPYFPVFVALPTVKQHLLEKGGLDRFVLESFALREADRAFLAETYEVVLVLDSLDEVGLTQEDVGAVVAEGGLLCRHPWVEAHCSVVVTVRGEYLKGVDTSPSGVCGAGVRAVYMQPFTEVDARTYIKRANTAWEKEKEQKKEKEKEKSSHKEERTVFVREEDVEGLVQLRNPFVLHMACHAQCSGKASEEVIYEPTWRRGRRRRWRLVGLLLLLLMLMLFRMCLWRMWCVQGSLLHAGCWRQTSGRGLWVWRRRFLIRSTVCVRLCGMRASAACRSGLRTLGRSGVRSRSGTSRLGSTLQHGGLHVIQQGHWGRWCSGASARTRSVCLGSLRRWCVETVCCTNVPAQSCLRL